MKGRFKVAGTLAGLLLLASPAAQAATHKDVTVTGAGATFPLNMIEQWKSDFNKSTGVSIAYTGVGSGAGRAQLIAGTVDFAGSDVPAAAAEVQQLNDKYGSFVSIPEIAGAISVQYNLPGITGLKLSGATLAKIFSGKVTSWNDPAIAADNGSAGPNLPIQVFVRSDKSGTSGVFTDYLSKVDAATTNPDGTLTLNYTTGNAGVYPISTVSYFLVPTKVDANKGDNLVAFLNYALGTAGQGGAEKLGYAPLPEKVRTASLAAAGKINATAAQATPAPAPRPTQAAAPAPTTTAPKAAPKPAVAASAAPKPAPAPAPTAAAAPDPAIASTGSFSARTAALAGMLLAFGGLCVGMGRKRRGAVRA